MGCYCDVTWSWSSHDPPDAEQRFVSLPPLHLPASLHRVPVTYGFVGGILRQIRRLPSGIHMYHLKICPAMYQDSGFIPKSRKNKNGWFWNLHQFAGARLVGPVLTVRAPWAIFQCVPACWRLCLVYSQPSCPPGTAFPLTCIIFLAGHQPLVYDRHKKEFSCTLRARARSVFLPLSDQKLGSPHATNAPTALCGPAWRDAKRAPSVLH